MIQLNPCRTQLQNGHDVCDGILDAIGDTPLVSLKRYLDQADVNLLAKLELFNPGGSAKDRPARQMIEHALASGEIDESSTIVESSSGNMGIGLAQVCGYLGLKFICVVDPHAQEQNVAIMQALGAKIDRVDEPIDGSYLAARWQRVSELILDVDGAFWPNQYANLQNPLAHQLGTICEIDQALDGELDYLFVAASSTGTASGCRDYLRAKGRSTKVIAVDALGSTLFGGTPGRRIIPGLGAGKEPPLAKGQQFDSVRRVRDIDCVVGCRRMAEKEAILVGGSAGGVLESVRSMQEELIGKTCVAILHDSGARYLDTVFSDQWVKDEIGVDPDDLVNLVERPAFSAVCGEGMAL